VVLGSFYPIFFALKNSKFWPKLQKIAKKSRGAEIAGLKILFPLIYDTMELFLEPSDRVSREKYIKELEAGMDTILTEFEKSLKETIIMWGDNSLDEDKKYQGIRNFADLAFQESVLEFMQKNNHWIFLEGIMEGIYKILNKFIMEMEENLDLFDTLALLFPGRNWNYSTK
jgi:uncharacterized protein with von Willebrand factor type A (vWA) domain